jgi:hypothetical protein
MHTFFGGESKPGTNYHLATTCAEFEAAMENANVVEPKEVQVVEVRMGTFDIVSLALMCFVCAGKGRAEGVDVFWKSCVHWFHRGYLTTSCPFFPQNSFSRTLAVY